MATCSSILAGKKTHGQRSLAGCSAYGCKEAQLSTLRSTSFTVRGHLFRICCFVSIVKWDRGSDLLKSLITEYATVVIL